MNICFHAGKTEREVQWMRAVYSKWLLTGELTVVLFITTVPTAFERYITGVMAIIRLVSELLNLIILIYSPVVERTKTRPRGLKGQQKQ